MDSRTRLPSSSDRDLVIAFKSGDEQAYDEIYRRHSPKIRAVCSRRLGQAFDTDEAVQETFLRAYQALGRFNGQYKLAAWLNRIAVNVCIDELRSRARSEIVENMGDRVIETQRGPDEIIASRRPEVMAALRELKPLHADVLRLRALNDLSHEELAAHLKITPAQAKSLLHRAKLAFKRIVREASGFVLIPLTAFRRHRKSDHFAATVGGANAAGLLTSLQLSLPMAERLMTGAVVAAIAISSPAPLETSPSELRSASKRVRLVGSNLRDRPSQPVHDARATASVDEPDAPSSGRVEIPLGIPDVAEVPERVTEHVKQKLDEHTNETDPGPDVEQPSELKEVGRKVTGRAEKIENVMPETPSDILGDS